MYLLLTNPHFSKIAQDQGVLEFVQYLEHINFPSTAINNSLTNIYFSSLKSIYELGDITVSHVSLFNFLFCVDDKGDLNKKALVDCFLKVKELFEDREKEPCIIVLPKSSDNASYRNVFEDIAEICHDIEFEKTLQVCTTEYLIEKVGISAEGH